ncbi:MAG: sugar transferase [Actinomycetota bacterium]|nr:sugar transferase [Actinomycetota bacterium]
MSDVVEGLRGSTGAGLEDRLFLKPRAARAASDVQVLHRRDHYERWVKPTFDTVVAGLLLIALVPLFAFVALLVYIRLGRPVILRQTRTGRGGKPFTMYKFRTMLPDRRVSDRPHHGPERRRNHKSANDPRHVPFGRVLRRASLDELPQLVNVVRGEMSLVGPRPELATVVESYQPWQHQRHHVKPGVTGLWQVTMRGDGPMHEHTDVDLDYIRQMSFLLDLRILAQTVPAALGRRRGE